MKKYQIWGIALVWLLSAFGFAIAETTEPATITAEVFMTELPIMASQRLSEMKLVLKITVVR